MVRTERAVEGRGGRGGTGGEGPLFRTGLAVAMALLAGGAATAQDVAARLGQLAATGTLQIGEEIYVRDADGDRTRGSVEELGSTGLRVRTKGGGTRAWDDAEVVEICRRDALANGAWIGAGIGVGAFLMECRYGATKKGICPVFPYGLIHFTVGAVLGASLDSLATETLYRAVTGVRVSPLISGNGAGAQLAVTWR